MAKNKEVILVQSQRDCISQSHVTNQDLIIATMTATIGAGLIGAIITLIGLKMKIEDSMLDREEKYRSNNYKFLRADTENGTYEKNDITRCFTNKTCRDFRQDVFELHFASMFIDYVNYRISFDVFYSRVIRISKNRNYKYYFSDDKDGKKLVDIITETCKIEIFDMVKYHKFLKDVISETGEYTLRPKILKLIPWWRRLLIKLNLGK